MQALFTSVFLINIFVLCITAADALTNRLISHTRKKMSVIGCLIIGGAALGECIGVLTNGAAEEWILLHKLAKLMEFSLTPFIGIAASAAYGKAKKLNIAVAAASLHAVFECVSVFTGWIFRVDSQNIYHREKLYWIYILFFSLSMIYGFMGIVSNEKEYQTGIDSVMGLTFGMLIFGITIQIMNSDIRIDFICIAIVNFILYSRYCKTILQVDALTRLLNRRCYEVNLRNVGKKAIVIILDVNKFKDVNDTYGHSAGDECLKNVANELMNVYGKYGCCYRIGGDEFCVVLNKNLDSFKELNRRFDRAIRELCEQDERMAGVSMGYACYDADTCHIQDVIDEADAMMYKQKEAVNAAENKTGE